MIKFEDKEKTQQNAPNQEICYLQNVIWRTYMSPLGFGLSVRVRCAPFGRKGCYP